MNEIKIKQLKKENIALYSLNLIAIDEETIQWFGAVYSIEHWELTNFEKDLPGKWEYSLIAVVDNKVVGFIIASESEGECLHISRSAIDSHFQKMGIGKMLFSDLLRRGKKCNKEKVSLFVNADNHKAINFFKNCGYVALSGIELLTFLTNKNRQAEYRGNYLIDNNNIRYLVYCYRIANVE